MEFYGPLALCQVVKLKTRLSLNSPLIGFQYCQKYLYKGQVLQGLSSGTGQLKNNYMRLIQGRGLYRAAAYIGKLTVLTRSAYSLMPSVKVCQPSPYSRLCFLTTAMFFSQTLRLENDN